MFKNRIDCHNHTRYSNIRLRDALARPEDLINRAIEIGLQGIAITDHDSLSAHPKANIYSQKIKEKYPYFKVILGNEIYLVDERPNNDHYHYILLAKDAIGHYQLRRLSSIAWLNSYTSKGLTRVDTLKTELEKIVNKNPGHLIASTACIGGELGKNILALTKAEKLNDKEDIQKYHDKIVNFILWNKALFKDDFYLEVQPGVSQEQIIVNRRILSIAQCFNLKMIATSDTHYLKKEDRYVHKAFLQSEEKEREVDAFYQDAYLHTEEDMIQKFALSNYDELFVYQMFKNSMEIYNKISDYSLLHSQQIPEVDVEYYSPICEDLLPEYPTLNQMYKSKDNIERYWVNQCINKLKEINKFNNVYLSELEEEAEVKTIIGKKLDTNMFSYPIALAHYINMMWECGSSVGVGRGSACSALNHYLLGITQLDSIEWNFPFFRYMNRDTDGLGDIDIDVCPSKVQTILSKIREERKQKFLPELELSSIEKDNLGAVYVCTFGTESSKSAILTSCRGYRSNEYPDGIDNDTAQYLSSLIPSERGFVWPISDAYYGNKEKDRKPIPSFVNGINEYPGLIQIILGIEGCISRRGRHASGVLFLGKDPYEFNAFMKTPNGEIVTQYDLHDAEACGSTKMDILVTEVQDKIVKTINFLQEHGEIESNLSLKEAYDKYLHPDVLPLNDENIWKVIQEANVLDLFQLDSEIGRQGAKKVKPNNMIELSSVNGLIRLMTAEKGQETWLERYVRYKNNIQEYYNDIQKYSLTNNEIQIFQKYLGSTLGIGISQEQLMRTLMDKDLCNYSLSEANKARKIVSKKKMSEIPNFKQKVYEKAKNQNIANYIWDFVVAPGLGYSFSDIHSTSYSFIGFQTAYIATKWNPIYWDTACLVVNSGALEEEEEEIVNIYEKENQAEYSYVDLPDRSGKKKTKNANYVKIAKAIGDIKSHGIEVSLININTSGYGFEPDIENNRILYGLKPLSNINSEIIKNIVDGRPYNGIKDFMIRCPLNKKAMVMLIKSGAFDECEETLGHDRRKIMIYYLSQVSDQKNKLNLQNMAGLIKHGLIPQELDIERRIYNFTKYLKGYCKVGQYYTFDTLGENFFNNYMSDYMEETEIINGVHCIKQKSWEKIYKKYMDNVRTWLKDNQEQILKTYNTALFFETWQKYGLGSIAAWEMEALCSYHNPHELINLDNIKYGIKDFFKMNPEPEVDYFFKRGNARIPIYKLNKIAGTVLAKDDNRSTVILLTTTGVVNVKFTRDYYAMFKKQISRVNPDGSKTVIEKSWFNRGRKLLIQGFRRDDQFVAKNYKSTGGHQLYLITDIVGNDIIIQHERVSADGTFEEEEEYNNE